MLAPEWNWGWRYECLDEHLSQALKNFEANQDDSDSDGLAECRQLICWPREGNQHVFRVKILREELCIGFQRAVTDDRYDYLRAGAGAPPPQPGEGAVAHQLSPDTTDQAKQDGVRRRFVLKRQGDEVREWTEWFADSVLRPLSLAAGFHSPYCDSSRRRTFAGHHCFALHYIAPSQEAQTNRTALAFHTDDADVTFNLSISIDDDGSSGGGKQHGGAIQYCDDLPATTNEGKPVESSHTGQRPGTPDVEEEDQAGRLWSVQQKPGWAIIHDENAYHSALPIETGSRTQLLYWAMWDDANWKNSFYDELERDLEARRVNAGL